MTYALRNDPSSQLPLAMNLFEAHHLDGQHLSDREFSTYQAMLFNLFPSGTQAREWLDSDECDAEVRRAYASAHRVGVTGVPFFVFQQKYAASGAMGVDEFVKVLFPVYMPMVC
jgi:predicted DsbA family dithiol-disulfide isomerase